MSEPITITPEINPDQLFNMKHRIADASRHARRLLAPRLGYTDAIDRFSGDRGKSNMDNLCKLAMDGEIGLSVIADDPSGQVAGIAIAEKGVTATSDKVSKTGIFVTSWFVGQQNYLKELTTLTQEAVELGKQLEDSLDIDETYEGIFALERVRIEVPEDGTRLTRFKRVAKSVIEAPVDSTANDVVHDILVGVGFEPVDDIADYWTRTRLEMVQLKDAYGNKEYDERNNPVKGAIQNPSNKYMAKLYAIN